MDDQPGTTGAAPRTEWAAFHYRVERDSAGVKASKRKLRRIAEQAAEHGDPIPEESQDIVRIYDREGRVVMERDWGANRAAAAEEEARIVEDLLHLDVVNFRARYGIRLVEPEEGVEGKPEGASG